MSHTHLVECIETKLLFTFFLTRNRNLSQNRPLIFRDPAISFYFRLQGRRHNNGNKKAKIKSKITAHSRTPTNTQRSNHFQKVFNGFSKPPCGTMVQKRSHVQCFAIRSCQDRREKKCYILKLIKMSLTRQYALLPTDHNKYQ